MSPAELAQILIDREERYGGHVYDVPRRRVSPHDPRPPEEINTGGMSGGDRMRKHGYSLRYACYLLSLIGRPVTVVEVGILKGTGLAIWCDLFPAGHIVGLDIDVSHYSENLHALHQAGAFSENAPTVAVWDQLDPDPEVLRRCLGGRKIDVWIDDGLHSDASICSAIGAALPFLAADAVCFFEDNNTADEYLQHYFSRVDRQGYLTVCKGPRRVKCDPVEMARMAPK